MKKVIAFLCCMICLLQAGAQQKKTAAYYKDSVAHKLHIRNGIFSTPVAKNTRINGIALGLAARSWLDADSLEVNGLNIELNPLLPAAGISAMLSAPLAPLKIGTNELFNCDSFPALSKLRWSRVDGVTVSTSIMEGANIRGMSINAAVSFANEYEGVELTGVMNLHYSFKGVIVAVLRNKCTNGKGLQIALFNNCRSGRVVQIGLLNRIGKRVLPVINCSLRQEYKAAP